MSIKQGLLIVNLGTPSQATPQAIKEYLAEFLRDRHVVDLNPLIWLPILHGLVIPKRLKYITDHYQQIWLNNQSPLLYYSKQICQKLQKKYPNFQCELAMTYGKPNLTTALNRLKKCNKIHILSLYPQYSTTTSLVVIDKIKALTQNWQNPPQFNYLYDYADLTAYIIALVKQIDNKICINQPDTLLISYHGIPIRYINKRHDEYVNRCKLTTELLQQKLQQYYPDLEIMMTYQSRFGKGKWTEPNTSDVLINLAKQEKSVAVVCPGFAVDCLETLYEINIENRALFIQHGGQQFNYIPALNDSALQLSLMKKLIQQLSMQ